MIVSWSVRSAWGQTATSGSAGLVCGLEARQRLGSQSDCPVRPLVEPLPLVTAHGLSARTKGIPMPDFNAVIVGSGISGSVTAYHLTEAGVRVLVLERGR